MTSNGITFTSAMKERGRGYLFSSLGSSNANNPPPPTFTRRLSSSPSPQNQQQQQFNSTAPLVVRDARNTNVDQSRMMPSSSSTTTGPPSEPPPPLQQVTHHANPLPVHHQFNINQNLSRPGIASIAVPSTHDLVINDELQQLQPSAPPPLSRSKSMSDNNKKSTVFTPPAAKLPSSLAKAATATIPLPSSSSSPKLLSASTKNAFGLNSTISSATATTAQFNNDAANNQAALPAGQQIPRERETGDNSNDNATNGEQELQELVAEAAALELQLELEERYVDAVSTTKFLVSSLQAFVLPQTRSLRSALNELREQVADNARSVRDVVAHCSSEVRQLGDSAILDGRRTQKIIDDLTLKAERRVAKLEREVDDMKVRNNYLRDEIVEKDKVHQKEKKEHEAEILRLKKYYEEKLAHQRDHNVHEMEIVKESRSSSNNPLDKALSSTHNSKNIDIARISRSHSNSLANSVVLATGNNTNQLHGFSSASSNLDFGKVEQFNTKRHRNSNTTNDTLRRQSQDAEDGDDLDATHPYHDSHSASARQSPFSHDNNHNNNNINNGILNSSTKHQKRQPQQQQKQDEFFDAALSPSTPSPKKQQQQQQASDSKKPQVNLVQKYISSGAVSPLTKIQQKSQQILSSSDLISKFSTNNKTGSSSSPQGYNNDDDHDYNRKNQKVTSRMAKNAVDSIHHSPSSASAANTASASPLQIIRSNNNADNFSPPGSRSRKDKTSTEDSIIQHLISGYYERHLPMNPPKKNQNPKQSEVATTNERDDVRDKRNNTIDDRRKSNKNTSANDFSDVENDDFDSNDDDCGDDLRTDFNKLHHDYYYYEDSSSLPPRRQTNQNENQKSKNNYHNYDDVTTFGGGGGGGGALTSQQYSPPPRNTNNNNSIRGQQQPQQILLFHKDPVGTDDKKQKALLMTESQKQNHNNNSMSDWARRELEARNQETKRLLHRNPSLSEVPTDAFYRKAPSLGGGGGGGGGRSTSNNNNNNIGGGSRQRSLSIASAVSGSDALGGSYQQQHQHHHNEE